MPSVGELGAEVYLDDSRLAATAQRAQQQFKQTGQAVLGFGRAAEQVDGSLKQFQAGIALLTKNTVTFSAATGNYVNTAGQHISTTQLLNQLGVQTTGQLRAQIAAVNDLAGAYQKDQAATAGLARIKQQLNNQLEGSKRSYGAASQGAFAFGNIIQDSAQFTFGFAQGIRSIANNIPNLIQGLSSAGGGLKGFLSSLKGPGGLIVAVNLATTAAVIFGDKIGSAFGKAAAQAKELAKQVGEAVKNIFSLKDAVQFEGDIGDLKRALDFAAQQVKAQQELVEARAAATRPGTGLVSRTQSEAEFAVPTSQLQEELSIRKAIQESLEGQLVAAKAQVRAEEIFNKLGIQRKGLDKEANKALLERIRIRAAENKSWDRTIDKINEALDRVREFRRNTSSSAFTRDTGQVELPSFGLFTGGKTPLGKRELATFDQSALLRLPTPTAGLALLKKDLEEASQLARTFPTIIRQIQASAEGLLTGTVSSLSRGISQVVTDLLFFGNGLTKAEEKLTLVQFKAEKLDLAKSLKDGAISAEEYRASLAVLNEQQQAFEDSLNRVKALFTGIKQVVKNTMASVVADVGAAVAKVLILKGLLAAFGGGTGFFSGVIQSVAAAGGVFSRQSQALPTLSQSPLSLSQRNANVTVVLQGGVSLDLDKLRFHLSENQARSLS